MIEYSLYADEEQQLPLIIRLIENDLSEPYCLYTYRYFLHQWPELCYVAYDQDVMMGVIICKCEPTKRDPKKLRGYIGMLSVDPRYRKQGIGSKLVDLALEQLRQQGAAEVMLETEVTNKGALSLYERMGFIRDKRLLRYYLNGVDAFRLKLEL
jgi:peptide alpha-N-acetyltransferase